MCSVEEPPVVGVSRETEQRLREFMELLSAWNEKINLVGKQDRAAIWSRHVADSLQLLPLIGEYEPPYTDLGCGAGFPGLVVAIASGRHVHLVEADQRKAAFLREAAHRTGAPVSVHADRIERVRIPRVSLAMARALAPLPRLIALATPLLRPDGVLIALKGRHSEKELTTARETWSMRVACTPSRTDSAALIMQISDIHRAA